MSDHFIPFRKHDILRLAHEGAPSGLGEVANLIGLVLRHEFQDRLERLKDLYHGMDPNADTKPVPGDLSRADPVAFSHELKGLLERANYRPLSDAELKEAFEKESVFRVKLHTRLDDFRELTIYTRSKHTRQEVLSSWMGLKKRTIDVDYFERVLLFIRFHEADHFDAKRRKTITFTPGTTTLKLFANVPAADLEMLFPNSEVRMKMMDKVVIGVPMIIGIVTMMAKILAVLAFLWAGVRWLGVEAGLHQEQIDISMLAKEAGLVLGAGLAIYLFIGRQLMRYRYKKIRFLQALSENLYFRNLDNNSGAFHRVLDDAQEEDVKEAVLAYRFLVPAPLSEDALDAVVEEWFKNRLGTTLDFEVSDGLAKLERLGLASRAGNVWTALPPDQAAAALRQRWATLAP